MTRYAAFLRGVNLGKRSVKSADLKAAFETLGYENVKTLLASGNVLFDAKAGKALKETIDAGLKAQFGFEILVVLRAMDDLRAMVAAEPFAGREGEDAKPHVMLFDEPLPKGLKLASVKDDYDVCGITEREVFMLFLRKPDGTYVGGSDLAYEKQLPKGRLLTMRNWNTILKAIA